MRNRPLLLTGLDNELYVERPDLESQLARSLKDRRSTLLIGERGMGKTTVLNHLIAEGSDRELLRIDASLVSTVHDFIRLIARAFGVLEGVPPGQGDDPVDLIAALELLPSRDATVIVDGSLDADVGYIFFGRLRDLVWRLPYTWIVSVTPDEAGVLRTPPADAFWSQTVQIEPFDADEIAQLLRRGLSDDELARLTHSGDMPISGPVRSIVRWAQDVVDGREPAPSQQQAKNAARLGRQASMALAELQALGRPAAASDEELLRRLGWSRTNASRWLSKMEGAGILQSFVGASEGQGRPPKLYEPKVNARA